MDHTIKILFLGQCLNYGYEGVGKRATFPHLAMSMLCARFPGLRFRFELKYLYHPRGLKALLRHRLLLAKPDIIVISLPAMFAATSWRVNAIYEIAPELVDTARSFLQKIDVKLKGGGAPSAKTLLDKTFTNHLPLTVEEYERLVEDAIESCRTGGCRIVLMGPGRFNEDTHEQYEVHSPELWESVNRMIIRLGERLKLAVIDAQGALTDYDGEVFLPNNHRFSLHGHEVVAREVESVLAAQVKALKTGAL